MDVNQESYSVLFPKRIRANFLWVSTRTLDFRSTQGRALPGHCCLPNFGRFRRCQEG